ncbi:MAG TPA: hypothetical protein VLN59_18270, partial [Burkholderiales bacterium]|nr:hypothetical protein [Burkholderiales bacterium]
MQRRPEAPGKAEPSQRFFLYTVLIAVALLLPAAIQALCSLFPGAMQPRDAAILIALALSGAIVATVSLIAALVRGETGRYP